MSLLSTTAAVATAVVAVIGITQVSGPTISTEVEIAAPVDAVWSELTNGSAYEDWNPFVRHLSGDLQVGSNLNVTVQAEGNAPMDFTPEVLVADENEELRWVGRLGFQGIFDGEHYFILEETDEGTTVLKHGENFRGLLSYPLFALIGGDTQSGFEAMNQALKARVEAGQQAS